jgi:predicted ribosome quality control (RQC) complex YloA/Tae2 family protein
VTIILLLKKTVINLNLNCSFVIYNMKIKKFTSSTGLEILVGQDDASNDYLSLKLARANDLWFHVGGFPGSHVVLRCAEAGEDKESIIEAAALAAWFSKMRNGKNVSVHYCLAQNVSKPVKAKAGTVNIKQVKKIKVNPQLYEDGDWV